MTPLNLPPFPIRISRDTTNVQRVFDPLRNRWIKLTPEEWVRQHFINYLVNHKNYPSSLLANEISIPLNGSLRRCDSVLYHREGLAPRMIIEYKAAHIPITEAVFRQVCAYNSELRADYVVVTNGITHYICEIDNTTHSFKYLPEIPDFKDLKAYAAKQ